jgi:hypothetical protein
MPRLTFRDRPCPRARRASSPICTAPSARWRSYRAAPRWSSCRADQGFKSSGPVQEGKPRIVTGRQRAACGHYHARLSMPAPHQPGGVTGSRCGHVQRHASGQAFPPRTGMAPRTAAETGIPELFSEPGVHLRPHLQCWRHWPPGRHEPGIDRRRCRNAEVGRRRSAAIAGASSPEARHRRSAAGRRAPAPGHCAAGFAGRPRQYRARKDDP